MRNNFPTILFCIFPNNVPNMMEKNRFGVFSLNLTLIERSLFNILSQQTNIQYCTSPPK